MTYTVIVAEDEELLLTNLVQKIQKADPDFLATATTSGLAATHKLDPVDFQISNMQKRPSL